MKEIFRQYGAVVITVIVSVAVFAIIGGYGLGSTGSAISNAMISQDDFKYLSSDSSGNAYDYVKIAKTPDISFSGNMRVYAAEPVMISDFLTINNRAMGKYELYAVQNSQGELINDDIYSKDDLITFADPGEYTLFLNVYNRIGKKSYAKINIPVNRR